MGYDVYGIDNKAFGTSENYADKNFYEQYIDCFNNTSKEFLSTFHTVIHCATHNILYAQDHPLDVIENNTLKTIDFFSRFDGKIINISTSSVYGDTETIPTKESDKINCTEAYSMSKRIVEMYLKKRGNYTTIRPSNFYGINQRPENPYAGVLGKFIHCALNDKPMTIYGTGEQTRSYTYVSDIVDSITSAVWQLPINDEVNVGSPEEISAIDLCKLVWKCTDKVVRYERVPERAIDKIKRRALDISKAKELLGWQPQISLEEGLKKTINWQKTLSK